VNASPLLDYAWISRQIPHQGTMVLLQQVLDRGVDSIRCLADSHRAPDNPLRAHGRLGIACGIEYAAQCMALHAALLAPGGAAPRAGYLASARALQASVSRLDDIDAPLIIEARRLHADALLALYSFSLSADGRCLLSGRASVVLDAEGVAPSAVDGNPLKPHC